MFSRQRAARDMQRHQKGRMNYCSLSKKWGFGKREESKVTKKEINHWPQHWVPV